jgi:hypothetical protein
VTIEALPFADPFEHDKGENLYDLRAFFAAAQDADTATKLTQSTRCVFLVRNSSRLIWCWVT